MNSRCSTLSRRLPSRFSGFLAFLTVAALPAAAEESGDRPPNVILVLVDDLGWTDLSCQGSLYYETPAIDRLAAEGARFTDAYAACAVCSPTRAAVLTGRYPARIGITDWIRARFQRGGRGTPEENPTEYVGGKDDRLLCPPNPFWMAHDELTIAEILRAAGYASAHVGKWHLGDDAWYPEHQGFDENHGGCDYGQPPSYFDPYTNRGTPQGIPTLPARRAGEYLTDRESDEAVGFIRRHRDRPFFLYLAHYAVHAPIQGKADLRARYESKPRTNQRNPEYAAMVHSVDQSVGRILQALAETGLAERTLVLFTSDNGGLLGPTDNAPLRSGKGSPYEGGIRVPLLVRWPGVVPAGLVSRAPVISVDCLPTILAAAGAAVPEGHAIDGISFLEHVRSGGAAPLARDELFWHFPHYRYDQVTPYSIIRAGEWKLIRYYEGPRFELFNLREDLGESTDLAAAEPERVGTLDERLMSHLHAVGARLPRPNPGYRPRVLILGDSISIGYTPFVRELLAAEADVWRPMLGDRAENCQGTNCGVENIDRWLAAGRRGFDVIHFNFGLHDMKRVDPLTGENSTGPADPRQAEPWRYEQQLREIVARLKATHARLVFATTTPVPAGVTGPHRDPESPARYNAIARKVMEENGIRVNDLYSFALPRLAEIQRPADVHFRESGSRALAERVTEEIHRALAAR